MNERIKKVRKALDLTQQKFADKLGMKQNTIATYEMGRATPSDPTIKSICREFNVNETWLRTGEGGDGAMFIKRTEEDELAAAVERLITGESAEFKRRLVNALSTLKDEHWLLLEEKLKEIVGMHSSAPVLAPTHTPSFEEDARAKAELYYRQLLSEQEQEKPASSAKESAGD